MEGIGEQAEMTIKNPYRITRSTRLFNCTPSCLLWLLIVRFCTIFSTCISWIKFNFCFCKAAAFASGLVFSYKLAEKAFVDVLITLFTDSQLSAEPERQSLRFHIVYSLRYATAFVNSLEGLSALMLIFLIYISEAFGGGHLKRSIFCLVVAYVCGLSILGFASSHVLSESYIVSLMIIIGLILVAVGRSRLLYFAQVFTWEQLEAHEQESDRQNRNNEQVEAQQSEPDQQNIREEREEREERVAQQSERVAQQSEPDQQNIREEREEREERVAQQSEPDQQNIREEREERVRARENKWNLFASAAGSLVATQIYNNMSWMPRLFTIGGVMGTTCVLFCLATPLYHKKDQAAATSTGIAEEPFTTFTCIRVLWAARSKRRERYLMYNSRARFFRLNNARCFCLHNGESELWPQAKSLRWIDKAAIIEGPEEQENACRLCSVTMVQETKYILKMVPMWFAFLVFGLVQSVGSTFYSIQGIYLESADVLLIYLFLLRTISREMVSNDLSPLCLLSKWFPKARLKRSMMKIWGGMVISILCSAVSWQVEVRRLDIFKNEYRHGMDSIPMSIWWLAPQFFLLGLMEGLAMDGLDEFTIDDDNLSKPMKHFLLAINRFVIYGIGSALNMLCNYSITKLHLDTLKVTRLDLYYKYLTIYGTTPNCVYLLLITIFIYCRD